MNDTNKAIARIFEDVGGYFYCDESNDYLDTRGILSKTKAEAMRRASQNGFTHAVGSGTYWDGVKKIPSKYACNQ